MIAWCELQPCIQHSRYFRPAVVHFDFPGSSGKGGKVAPKPYWAYRGQKQSEKAQGSSMVGQVDQWGGRYVEGGYTIDGQFFPLPGVDWVGWYFHCVPTLM